MSMDKRWQEMFSRLEALETAVSELVTEVRAERVQAVEVLEVQTAPAVTKAQLTAIKGVGSSLADEILKVING